MRYTDSWTRRQRALVAGIVLTGAAFTLPNVATVGAADPVDPGRSDGSRDRPGGWR